MRIRKNEWQIEIPFHHGVHRVAWQEKSTDMHASALSRIEVKTLFAKRREKQDVGASTVGTPIYYAVGEATVYLLPEPDKDCELRILYAPPLVEI